MHREREYLPRCGDFLGDFTNEINPAEGSYIQEFVSGDPKVCFEILLNINHLFFKNLISFFFFKELCLQIRYRDYGLRCQGLCNKLFD